MTDTLDLDALEARKGQIPEFYALIARVRELERLTCNQTLTCGHHRSLEGYSVESKYWFCELCKAHKNAKSDAEMIARLRNKIDFWKHCAEQYRSQTAKAKT